VSDCAGPPSRICRRSLGLTDQNNVIGDSDCVNACDHDCPVPAIGYRLLTRTIATDTVKTDIPSGAICCTSTCRLWAPKDTSTKDS